MKPPTLHVAIIGEWRNRETKERVKQWAGDPQGVETLTRCGLWVKDDKLKSDNPDKRWCKNCSPGLRAVRKGFTILSVEHHLKKAQDHLDTASNLALNVIEYKARAILKRNPRLKEFLMAMGTWYFINQKNEVVSPEIEHLEMRDREIHYSYVIKPWAMPVARIIDAYNSQLKLTGEPIRFTADGPVVRDW